MADGISGTPGTGIVIASDDIGGTQYQRVKLTQGADGTNDGDVSKTNPLPVAVALSADMPWSSAPFQYSTSGDKALIAGVALNYIRVYGLLVYTDAGVVFTLEDTALAAFFGAFTLIAGGKLELPIIGRPYFKLGVGLGLDVKIGSSGPNVVGVIFYTQSTAP